MQPPTVFRGLTAYCIKPPWRGTKLLEKPKKANLSYLECKNESWYTPKYSLNNTYVSPLYSYWLSETGEAKEHQSLNEQRDYERLGLVPILKDQ